MFHFLFVLLFLSSFNKTPFSATPAPLASPDTGQYLAKHEFSLDKRYGNSFVNDVFRDNILLALNYAAGKQINPAKIDWSNIDHLAEYKLVLKPGETFAFHDDVLPEYQGKVTKSTGAHFNSAEGFKSDGYLVGDGVCHLASLLYWVAKDAGLKALAPTRHDFAPVPEVPAQYGVSIYNYPGKSASNEAQNLYITNNLGHEVAFEFKVDHDKLSITAAETN